MQTLFRVKAGVGRFFFFFSLLCQIFFFFVLFLFILLWLSFKKKYFHGTYQLESVHPVFAFCWVLCFKPKFVPFNFGYSYNIYNQKQSNKLQDPHPWGVELYNKQWKYNYHASHWFSFGALPWPAAPHSQMKWVGQHQCWYDRSARCGIKKNIINQSQEHWNVWIVV